MCGPDPPAGAARSAGSRRAVSALVSRKECDGLGQSSGRRTLAGPLWHFDDWLRSARPLRQGVRRSEINPVPSDPGGVVWDAPSAPAQRTAIAAPAQRRPGAVGDSWRGPSATWSPLRTPRP